jgi:Fic family protein
MQVVSGAIGRQRVHYEAPPPDRLPQEMERFLMWFAGPGDTDPLLVAGLAHFWFVTIHPFDDGNGRIARAIADMALARAEDSPRRYYSMSRQISSERTGYYETLERSQKGGCDITAWQEWFLACLRRAITNADETVELVLRKARFWQRFAEASLNERQIKVLNRLLGAGGGRTLLADVYLACPLPVCEPALDESGWTCRLAENDDGSAERHRARGGRADDPKLPP